jgi:phosphoglycolate phosphatase
VSEGSHPSDGSVRGVVFDLDGTLVDSYAAIAESLNAARAAFGMGPLAETAVRGLVGHGLESLLESQVGRERVPAAVRTFRERYARIGVARTTALPGVAAGLRALAEHGYRLAVATNKPAAFAGPILAALDLSRWFSCIVGPDLVGTTKPDPRMLHHCLRVLDVPPEHALYVGDMALDVETADRAGVAVVLVCGGSSSPEELRSTGRPTVPSFDALVRRLVAGDRVTSARDAPSPS